MHRRTVWPFRQAVHGIRIWSAVFALAIAPTLNSAATLSPSGNWTGFMDREGSRLSVRFDFKISGGALSGDFSSETQKALEFPVSDIAFASPSLHWKLGDSLVFDGVVSAGEIRGAFRDGAARGTFALKRDQPVVAPYRRAEIRFRNGATELAGTLLRPRGTGRRPGIVFLHGSGPESRWGTSLYLADRFARSGIAALVFDKRGVGESTGDWKATDYEGLAEDYLAAVRFLQSQEGVNPASVGIYGHSQGATLSPLISCREGAVAFVIAAAAIGTGPIYQQDIYRTRNELMDDGFREPQLSAAMSLYSLWIDTMRGGRDRPRFESALAKAKNEKWLPALEIPPESDWIWKWYPHVGNFNPIPLWEKVRVPVLLIYGEMDRNTPVGPSLAGISRALARAGNSDYSPVILPGAVHNLTIQWSPGQPFFWWHTAPGFTDLMIAWVRYRFLR